MNILPPTVKQAAADTLDAKVAQGKVVRDWRHFWKWRSVQLNIVGFLMSVGQSAGLAYLVWEFHTAETSHWFLLALAITTALVFLASMVYRLKNQQLDKPDEPDETDGAGF